MSEKEEKVLQAMAGGEPKATDLDRQISELSARNLELETLAGELAGALTKIKPALVCLKNDMERILNGELLYEDDPDFSQSVFSNAELDIEQIDAAIAKAEKIL